MNLRTRVGQWFARSDATISVNEWASYFNFMGVGYPFMQGGTLAGKEERPDPSFLGYAGMLKSNPIIFSCARTRMAVFSEARLQWREIRNGRPGDLFGTQELAVLERPWPNGTTGDLLARAILTADAAGNFYAVGHSNWVECLRPDWMTIILGSHSEYSEALDPNAELAGYAYTPGGIMSGNDPIPLLPEDVAHFAPIPDPCARYRGMSWLDPIIREVVADNAMSNHKLKFFEQGATPNMFVALDNIASPDQFDEWVAKYRSQSEGLQHAYKTMFMAAGHSPTVVGANLRQIDFKTVQGAGETRIAAAAGVPPVIVGLSEGLDAATYSNYAQARRAFADGTLRWLWRNFAGSLATLVNVPPGAELWYDDRDISFLQEDRKDAAEIQSTQMQTIKAGIEAGYEPDAVIDAVTAEDFERLKGKHSGLTSVQLQPPDKSLNGNSSNGKADGVQLALPAAGD